MMNLRLSIVQKPFLLNFIITVITLWLLALFTVWTLTFLQKNRNRLHMPIFKERYGSLFAKVEYYNHKEAIKFTFFFCLRRLLNAGIIAFFQSSIVLQVFCLVQIALLMTSWAVKHRPMIDLAHNIMLISNEFVVLMSSYLILIFSDYVPTVEDRH